MPILLIVDDVMENVRLLKHLLQDIGQVVFAASGEQALEMSERHRPDLVLLDAMMPGMDGYETCRRLKARPASRDTPVLFVTGADGERDEARGLAAGAIDYITKPFSPGLVRARVQNHLALVAARRAHRQWVADTSHELRTPITILSTHLEAMRDGVIPVTAAALDTLWDTVQGMEHLVADLHQLAGADAGAQSFHYEIVDLAELVEETAQLFAPRFAAQRIAFGLALQLAAPARVWADRQRLGQVLANLWSNTLRYADAGARLQVELADADVGPGRLRLRVEDSGPGVPAESLPRLFERFYRVDASRNRAGGGSGLGLAICQALVQAHGGAIAAGPAALGGLAIEITLPAAAP